LYCFSCSAIFQQIEIVSMWVAINYSINYTQNGGMMLLLIFLREILHSFFRMLIADQFNQTFYKLSLCSMYSIGILSHLAHSYFCCIFISWIFHFHWIIHYRFDSFFMLYFFYHFSGVLSSHLCTFSSVIDFNNLENLVGSLLFFLQTSYLFFFSKFSLIWFDHFALCFTYFRNLLIF